VSDAPKEYCHWSRTFAPHGGICVIPLTTPSRFPDYYVMYGPGAAITFRPKDPNIRVRDGFLEILGPTKRAKLGFDSAAGWLAYLIPNDRVFVKRYPVYPERAYNEVAALTISIYYPKAGFCELEPIGPKERIPPGGAASFTEDWWLLEKEFPSKDVDLKALADFVEAEAK